jgi:hypothetical protein
MTRWMAASVKLAAAIIGHSRSIQLMPSIPAVTPVGERSQV